MATPEILVEIEREHNAIAKVEESIAADERSLVEERGLLEPHELDRREQRVATRRAALEGRKAKLAMREMRENPVAWAERIRQNAEQAAGARAAAERAACPRRNRRLPQVTRRAARGSRAPRRRSVGVARRAIARAAPDPEPEPPADRRLRRRGNDDRRRDRWAAIGGAP